MFDFAWSEIGLIAAVALILIGPKDLPVAIRAVTDMVKKARRMASEFQTHVDEMLREANLDEVRTQISQIRNFDVRGMVEGAVDADGSLRKTFTSDPLNPQTAAASAAVATDAVFDAPAMDEVAVAEAPTVVLTAPESEAAALALPVAPAFVPPNLVPAVPQVSGAAEAPAFIPPGAVLQSAPRQP